MNLDKLIAEQNSQVEKLAALQAEYKRGFASTRDLAVQIGIIEGISIALQIMNEVDDE